MYNNLHFFRSKKLRTLSGWFHLKYPKYKNPISLNPENGCSCMRVFTVLYGQTLTYKSCKKDNCPSLPILKRRRCTAMNVNHLLASKNSRLEETAKCNLSNNKVQEKTMKLALVPKLFNPRKCYIAEMLNIWLKLLFINLHEFSKI